MREVELDEIQKKAHQYHDSGLKWHFHILTPTCVLNEKDHYAFVLECPDKAEKLVHYSSHAERELGQELAPLAHGAKILEHEKGDTDHKPSAKIQKVINRAKQLNDQGVEWHHHVLALGCQFNTNPSKFIFVFEDPQTGQKIENLTDKEPTADLKFIEKLFYKK